MVDKAFDWVEEEEPKGQSVFVRINPNNRVHIETIIEHLEKHGLGYNRITTSHAIRWALAFTFRALGDLYGVDKNEQTGESTTSDGPNGANASGETKECDTTTQPSE